ncbi:dephospho-CoA kinase [uncultured Ruminococcus sp.]|uniref:dephospho-CoA kinase n=1 Tax=uncultured Ruminococcus sp. TaxID=165186 RepID=UPI00260DF13C|nr:dephospho-CoA kinase [uncultured Ruminococcus sp.]
MNSLDGVMVIGLTGQTGAGKSTVSKVFVQNGFRLIDADAISRLVVKRGSHCLADLRECFSDVILTADGELDRKAMAAIAFSDHHKLEMLNTIMYPYIMGEILRMIHRFSQQNHKLILLDAPTLFESRADDFCDLIISVVAEPELRKHRIMNRDHISEEAAQKRMQMQHSESFFREHSDTVLENNTTFSELEEAAQELSAKLIRYYETKFGVLV